MLQFMYFDLQFNGFKALEKRLKEKDSNAQKVTTEGS